jgi:hypothetical protein
VISSSVTCTVSTTDASAPLKTRSWSASGGANTSSVSLYNFGLPFSARGTNKVCVSGSFVYADSTLTIPTRCTTF